MSQGSEHSVGHGIVPVKYYVSVFVALIALTVLTVYTAKYVDLGKFNFALAMVIAGGKALLVFAIFMGLLWDKSRFNIIIICLALFFFLLFIGLTALDVLTRGSIYAEEANSIDTQTKLRVEGYFQDIPKGGDISTEELLQLKNEKAE